MLSDRLEVRVFRRNVKPIVRYKHLHSHDENHSKLTDQTTRTSTYGVKDRCDVGAAELQAELHGAGVHGSRRVRLNIWRVNVVDWLELRPSPVEWQPVRSLKSYTN